MQLSTVRTQCAAPLADQQRHNLRSGYYLVLPITGERHFLGSDITDAALCLDSVLDKHVMSSRGYWIDYLHAMLVMGRRRAAWLDEDQVQQVFARLETLAGLCH